MSDSKKVTATNRSVAIGGNATNVHISTGDTAMQQGATLEDFLVLLTELRKSVAEAPLEAQVVADVEAEAESVKEQAERKKPNSAMILGKLKTITDVLAAATGAGEKLVPMARRLGEIAGQLF